MQFTRDPEGIAGALKKIAVYSEASWLQADSEEVAHMLFGPGQAMHLFATHPPLLKRIARIEPGFREQQLQILAERIKRDRARSERAAAREARKPEQARQAPFDAGRIIEQIGNPDMQQLLLAAGLAAGLPDAVRSVADAPEQAPVLVLFSLLDADAALRDLQLLAIAQQLGAEVEAQVRQLARRAGVPNAAQRLPLLEIALPTLRRQPAERVQALLRTAREVIRVDGQVDAFEYLLARMIRQYLWEAANPQRARLSGKRSLRRLEDDALRVMSVVARHGHDGDNKQAREAFAAGATALLGPGERIMPEVTDWLETLDPALDRLDELKPADKQRLVHALLVIVSHDQALQPVELELMRAVGIALHVPVPVLVGNAGSRLDGPALSSCACRRLFPRS